MSTAFRDWMERIAGANRTKLAIPMELTGSNVDKRGLAANKPLATAVEAGTTYWSVDTDPNGDAIEISDGTSWTVMV